MALILQENYTVKLIEQLKRSEIDAAILALPLPEAGLMIQPLYDEEFIVAIPRDHPWKSRDRVTAADLKDETMLLLGAGHCFRDQVLEVCPELEPLPVALVVARLRHPPHVRGLVARDDPAHGGQRHRRDGAAAHVGPVAAAGRQPAALPAVRASRCRGGAWCSRGASRSRAGR